MKRLLEVTVLVAGAAYAAWWYWQSAKQANAAAWAAGTDQID